MDSMSGSSIISVFILFLETVTILLSIFGVLAVLVLDKASEGDGLIFDFESID